MDRSEALRRRRSPGWVRATPDPQLHALAFRLRREFWEGCSSPAQDWLLDACLSELEYRRRRKRSPWDACSCELCCSPFPD